ncbi:MAG: KUP/HAK/KT family potassium transporter, partial [Gemmatimonadaceae bacterium]
MDPEPGSRSAASAAASSPAAAPSPAPTAASAAATQPPASSPATAEHPTAEPHRHQSGHHVSQNPRGRELAFLSLTALGVVYGDIGTSPLYSIQEAFKPQFGLAPTPVNVFGVLSLVVWALVLVVSIKYVFYILRADNRGEGGVLALLA